MKANQDIKSISGWRWLAAWLMGLLLATSLVACGSVTPVQPESTQAEAATAAESAAPAAGDGKRRSIHEQLRISRPMLAKERATLGTPSGERGESL